MVPRVAERIALVASQNVWLHAARAVCALASLAKSILRIYSQNLRFALRFGATSLTGRIKPLSRCSLFRRRFDQWDTEEKSGVAEEPSSEPTAKKLRLARGMSAKSRNSSPALRQIRAIG
jgi:hypothetical protein